MAFETPFGVIGECDRFYLRLVDGRIWGCALPPSPTSSTLRYAVIGLICEAETLYDLVTVACLTAAIMSSAEPRNLTELIHWWRLSLHKYGEHVADDDSAQSWRKVKPVLEEYISWLQLSVNEAYPSQGADDVPR